MFFYQPCPHYRHAHVSVHPSVWDVYMDKFHTCSVLHLRWSYKQTTTFFYVFDTCTVGALRSGHKSLGVMCKSIGSVLTLMDWGRREIYIMDMDTWKRRVWLGLNGIINGKKLIDIVNLKLDVFLLVIWNVCAQLCSGQCAWLYCQ